MSEITSPAGIAHRDTTALVALIAGVAAIVLFILAAALTVDWLWPFGVIAGVIAVIAGVISLRRARAEGRGRNAQALAGLVLGAIVVAWFVIWGVLALTGVIDA